MVVRESVVIPYELSAAAEQLHLSYAQTLELLDAYNSVVARRSNSGGSRSTSSNGSSSILQYRKSLIARKRNESTEHFVSNPQACPGPRLRSTEDPVPSIIQFCEKRVRNFLKEFPKCTNPSELLDILAAKLRTKFEIIRSDQDLNEIKSRYVAAGETAFANLETDFPVDVFGVTFRRLARETICTGLYFVIDSRAKNDLRTIQNGTSLDIC